MDILRILKILYECLIEKEKPTDEALLSEYQALQHDNSSSGTNHWTVTGIFVGISSVILAGLIYGVFANKDLFATFIQAIEGGSNTEINTLRIIVSLLGCVIITIFYFLRLWMRRVTFLQRINFERMRDIERDLGIWKSWRVHGIDHWKHDNFDFDDKDKIGKPDKARLISYKPRQWWDYERTSKNYEGSSTLPYNVIFGALIFLWLSLILIVWLPLIIAFPTSPILAFPIAAGIAALVIYLTRTG